MPARKKSPKYKSRVHTVACYPDTWDKFNKFKHEHHMTGNQVLNVLIDNYTEEDVTAQKQYLINISKRVQKDLENYRKHFFN